MAIIASSKVAGQKDFYIDHLNGVLLPFWLERSIDSEFGGYFTCFENSGTKLASTDKYTWSQGRMVWILSQLSCMDIYKKAERENFLSLAASGAQFLMKNCVLENGNCTFLMDRAGNRKALTPESDPDISFYADCFVIIGLSKYSRASGDRAAFEFARDLYGSVIRRIDSGSFKAEPYPAPKGYRHHGVPMILLNTSQELAGAAEIYDCAAAGRLRPRSNECGIL